MIFISSELIKVMTDADTFIRYVSEHYDGIKDKLTMLSGKNGYAFDPDGMQESIVRCYTAISKKGFLQDKTPYGIEAYLIRSYVNYIKEDKRACVNSKRDLNISSDDIQDIYEDWYNNNHSEATNKIRSDLFKDFSCLYILTKVDENWDAEHSYLFRLKTLYKDMTYKKLAETTKLHAVRQKVIEVKKWLQSNITKEEIRNAFYTMYGDLI